MNKKILLVTTILLFFILGVYQNNDKIKLFAHPYFSYAKDLIKYGSPHKVKKRNNPTTAVHKLAIERYEKSLPEGHIVITYSDRHKIDFLHISVNGPSVINKATYDVDKKLLNTKTIVQLNNSSRGTDIFISPSSKKIFVTYVYIDKKTCASLVLSELNIYSNSETSLKTIYQSKCTLPAYGIHQSGGVLAEDNLGNLYLTVGDFSKSFPHPNMSDFGNVLVKYKGSNKFILYSFGHRNPQGIYWDDETKTLLETEHGPQGGDEINRILKNKDYGWPHVTYGTGYGDDSEGEMFTKGYTQLGLHDGFEKPIFAFVPSIGIKALTKMLSTTYEFPHWLGNYFIVSSKALYRVEINDNRVIYSEPIYQLNGLRDIKIASSGIIIGSGPEGIVVVRRKK